MSERKYPVFSIVSDRHTFASLIAELKRESVAFVGTRAELFFSELRDKTRNSRKVALFGGLALIFGGVAFLLFSVAAVALVAIAFWGTPFAFFWGFLIIGICYLLMGAINSMVAYYGFTGLAPRKTIEVLRDDKSWLQAEVSQQS
jgi:uncharacterized membrane protein YqjE